MELSLVHEGPLAGKRCLLDSKDGKYTPCIQWHVAMLFTSINVMLIIIVFLVDTGKEVFVWVGSGASSDEKKNAMTYAHVRQLYQLY